MHPAGRIASSISLEDPPELLFPLHSVRLAQSGDYNAQLALACEQVADAPDTGRSHFVQGRFENLYPPRDRLPLIEPLISAVSQAARRILGRTDDFRVGFWINRMAPGHLTSRHSHEENDELLSAVYYVQVPQDSGQLVFHQQGASLRITPEAGMLLLFAPWLEHEVDPHRGEGVRLSVAFNLGPATEAC